MFYQRLLGFLATGAFAVLLVGAVLAAPTAGSASQPPWLHGERLAYDISWGWFHAGQAELLFERQPVDVAEDTYRITARAWTEGVPFTLLEHLQSFGEITEQGLQASRYVQQQKENDYLAYKTVEMDRLAQEATYENHRNAEPPQRFELMPNAQDMMSALYHLRMTVPTLAMKSIPMNIVTLGAAKPMLVEVGEPQLLRVPTYAKNKLVVRPVTPHIPNSKQDWVIYITDDAHMVPVQILLKSKFGTFKANLKAVNGKSQAPKSLPVDGPLFQ